MSSRSNSILKNTSIELRRVKKAWRLAKPDEPAQMLISILSKATG